MAISVFRPSFDSVGGNGFYADMTTVGGSDHGECWQTDTPTASPRLEATAADYESHRCIITAGTDPMTVDAVISSVRVVGYFIGDARTLYATVKSIVRSDGGSLSEAATVSLGTDTNPDPALSTALGFDAWNDFKNLVTYTTNPITSAAWTSAQLLAYDFGMHVISVLGTRLWTQEIALVVTWEEFVDLSPDPVTITPTSLAWGMAGKTYDQMLTGHGGDGGPYTFTLVLGTLPPGVVLHDYGLLLGTIDE